MTRAYSTVAVVCLALGSADVVYLNLAVAPALMGDITQPVSPVESGESGGRTVRAAKPAPPPGEVARGVPGSDVRDLDPELTARTGAEPEPEAEHTPLAQVASATTGTVRAPIAAEGKPPGDLERGSDALQPEPVHILFERDQARLGAAARVRLERVAGWLSSEPSLRARVDGHADSRGDSTHNDQLSRQRAESVATFLETRGIARARITVRAFGERRPVDRRAAFQAFRRNRRVELRVSSPPERSGTP
jgi:outer membrane protein OmpA-like peptidoglycan-associated protein